MLPSDSEDDASSTDSSYSVREETASKETASAPETCRVCQKEFGRPQELERHIRELHLPHHLYCWQPSCTSTGTRAYSLKESHYADKHPGVPLPEQDPPVIYDAKVLAKQVRNKEIGIEEAVREARTLFEEKAEQEGKLGSWRRRWAST